MKICKERFAMLLRFGRKNSGDWDNCDHGDREDCYLPADKDVDDLIRGYEYHLHEDCNSNRHKAYIAGPMTGLPDLNYPLFNRVAAEVESYGYSVFNPAFREDQTRPWKEYMKENIVKLVDCDVMVLLPGWEESKGATLERAIAVALGMPLVLWLEEVRKK